MVRCNAVVFLSAMVWQVHVQAAEIGRIFGTIQRPVTAAVLTRLETDYVEPLNSDLEPFVDFKNESEVLSEDTSRGYWGRVTAGVWLGGLQGHLQTPAGGGSGTTSSHRPTIDEIGLDGAEWMTTLDARFRRGDRHEFHFSYIDIGRSGSDVLGTSLISHNRTFPAGSQVESNFGLDTFRFGYRPHHWQRCLGEWTLTPEIGVGVAQFEYQLRSPSASGPIDRSYNIGFPYLGFLLERPIGERFGLEVDFTGMGGINGISFIDSDFRFVYHISNCKRWNSAAVLGWRGMWFRRHDGQSEAQNDPNLRIGWLADDPWTGLTLGLRIGF
jgi:hypothetical protein